MKIGLYYEDKFTHELFKCVNFTYSYYIWKNNKGEIIEEDKFEAWKHINPRAVNYRKKLKDEERGEWECPFCGTVHMDPSFITVTCCGHCNNGIVLSQIWKDGHRSARPYDDVIKYSI